MGRRAWILAAVVNCILLVAPAAASSSDYAVSAWGDNTYGQLGSGTSGWGTASKVPTAVTGLTGVRSIAAGWVHNLALRDDGTVWAWGGNGAGALGDGTIDQRDSPVEVGDLRHVAAVAAGSGHSLALLEDGTVMAWGRNYEGQLGTGGTSGPEVCMSELSCSTHPVPVPGLSEVTAIAAGENFSLALLDDGTVMAWGEGQWGQLGIGTSGLRPCGNELLCNPTPTRIEGLEGVAAVAAGFHQSLALLEDGTVVTWGYNGNGGLGVGTTEGPETCGWEASCSRTPVPVPGLSEVADIAAGGLHDLALLNDGTVRAWGYNAVGQLGDGTSTDRDRPVSVSGLNDVTDVSGGMYHSLALLQNGTAMSWGWNVMWTLGSGSAGEESRVPVPVSGLTGVMAISGGNMHSLALGDAPALTPKVSGIEPNVGPVNGGTSVGITGSGFGNVQAVKFGSVDAAGFVVHSDSYITAVSPPGEGAVDVTVTNSEGSSYASWRSTFYYGPRVWGIDPAVGPTQGGTQVTISGVGFSDAAAVRFGSNDALDFEVKHDGEILAVVPPGTGTVHVVVETPAGETEANPWDQFQYWSDFGVEGLSPEGQPELLPSQGGEVGESSSAARARAATKRRRCLAPRPSRAKVSAGKRRKAAARFCHHHR